MISYLKRNELDVAKYNACIADAVNSRVYAYSWYLDCVADNWDALVLNDYEAVMPLPWRKKFMIKYVYLVNWVQQLGIFHNEGKEEIIEAFFNAVPKEFKFIEIFFNSQNSIGQRAIRKRTNYILNLDKSYSYLIKNFSKGRKSDIKKAVRFNVEISTSTNPLRLINLFKEEKNSKIKIDDKSYQYLEKLTSALQEKGKIKILEAYIEEEFLGGAFFLFDGKRITYLFSSTNQRGKQFGIMSLIINSIIQDYEKTNFVFDFEGSMIEGVASFFKSFGAQEEIYYHYRKYFLF